MSEPSDLLRNTLKSQGHSLTAVRRAVFGALLNKEPQTMQQLVAACPGVDRASVYRTVSLFEQAGIVNRLQIGWKYKLELSDAFHHHHHHLTCQQCGRTIPFNESPDLEATLQQIAASNDFFMKGHQLEIQGTCSACKV
jgi:Fur family transcriptional regulator, ferric uptake regulator